MKMKGHQKFWMYSSRAVAVPDFPKIFSYIRVRIIEMALLLLQRIVAISAG
jgi:hypothetical protein